MSAGPRRRAALGLAAAWPALARAATGRAPPAPARLQPRALVFPADHGAHPDTRTEWWYVTGWLRPGPAPAAAPATPQPPALGFQVTFFRSRTGLATEPPSAFTATQLVMAHAALSDVAARRQWHDQRLARAALGWAGAAVGDAAVRLHDWALRRDTGDSGDSADGGHPGRAPWLAQVASAAAGFALQLRLRPTQPVLLQGDHGWSRKGPRPEQASQYVSLPQLAASGRVTRAGAATEVHGRAWLDHEWSDEILPAQAVGWDWLGINLDDGSALTAFRLRRPDGSALWAGGSWRGASAAAAQAFAPQAVALVPLRHWTSPATGARYPVAWTVQTPAGRWTLQALFEAQELDTRASTGTVYWEGLAELQDAAGRRVGLGYLEMTGYAGRLRL